MEIIKVTGYSNYRLLRYLVVGAANTLLAYLIYAIGLYFSLSVPSASLLSLILGITISFFSHGKLVFGNPSVQALFRFLFSWSLLYVLYIGIVVELGKLGMNPYWGGIVATLVTAGISYVIMRRYVFRTGAAPTDLPGSNKTL